MYRVYWIGTDGTEWNRDFPSIADAWTFAESIPDSQLSVVPA